MRIVPVRADLAASGGQVKLHERLTLPEEIGKPLSAIATGPLHLISRPP
ncbi:hypothetical protein [Sphingobium sp.]|nr:hypothetical protein [Sphingobium sp.]